MHKPCAVIPVYNHEQAVPAVVDDLLRAGLPCVLVDDAIVVVENVERISMSNRSMPDKPVLSPCRKLVVLWWGLLWYSPRFLFRCHFLGAQRELFIDNFRLLLSQRWHCL